MKKEGPPKPPVDEYTREAFQTSLDHLSKKENEGAAKIDPLEKELATHTELREEDSTSPYPLAEEEARVRSALEGETASFRKEVDEIKQDLWRQLSNAQTEAIHANDEMESKKAAQIVLPEILKIESETYHKMEDTSELSERARVYGKAVIEVAEEAKRKIVSEKPSPSAMRAILRSVQELSREFARLLGNALSQDRYGHPLSEGGAA